METPKPLFLQLNEREQMSAVEALIFASEEPLTTKMLFNILIIGEYYSVKSGKRTGDTEDSSELYDMAELARQKYNLAMNLFEDLVAKINEELISTSRPFQIIRVGNGYQYCTRKEFGELIYHLNKTRAKKRFSQAALETLAIVAYKQPVTKPEIDQIRGVSSSDIVNSLVDKSLLEIKGKKDAIGKPFLYGTTIEFLKVFGLNNLEELPKLKDAEELTKYSPELSDKNYTIDVSELPFDAEPATQETPEVVLEKYINKHKDDNQQEDDIVN